MPVIENGEAALEIFNQTGQISFDGVSDRDLTVWMSIFELNLAGWSLIALETQRRWALSALAALEDTWNLDIPQASKESSLRLVAMSAWSSIGGFQKSALSGGTFKSEAQKLKWEQLFQQLRPEVKKIWLDIFAKFPLENEIIFMCERFKKDVLNED